MATGRFFWPSLYVLFILGWVSFATFCVGDVGYVMLASLPVLHLLIDRFIIAPHLNRKAGASHGT